MNRKFSETYGYGRLISNHSLTEEGVWDIYGEDPNCDMGGSHSQPYLGRVSGRLQDVIEFAEQLSGFWQWGAGGEIRKYNPPNVKHIKPGEYSAAATKRRSEEKADIQRQIEELQEKLNKL